MLHDALNLFTWSSSQLRELRAQYRRSVRMPLPIRAIDESLLAVAITVARVRETRDALATGLVWGNILRRANQRKRR